MQPSDEILAGLDDGQLEAVLHDRGPMLVIAGAGTGKTRVITARIARLIASGKDPAGILALTFTDKAAAEMEERIDCLAPYGCSNVSVSTFHAFGDRVLRDSGLSIGLSPDFKVLSESETIIFLKRHLFELPLDRYRPASNPAKFLGALIRFIGRLKDEDVSKEEYSAYVERLKALAGKGPEDRALQGLFAEQTELFGAYVKSSELMAKDGLLDYGDQICLALKLFRERPDILKRYAERFKYILVDEFQDTNYAQFELLRLLAGHGGGADKNLMVVADDDQSIYKFRGAAVSNVLKFSDVYPGCKTVTLKRNYRSVQPILDAAYRLINNNNPERLEIKNGIDKRLVSLRPVAEGGGISHVLFNAIGDEASFVAETIQGKVSEGRAAYRDFAVLVRARSDARPFLAALDQAGVPYRYSGGSGLYSREEIVLLISFLKAIVDFTDDLSLFHLARSSVYGLVADDLIPLNNLSRQSHAPLFYVMKDVAAGALSIRGITAAGVERIKRLTADVERFSRMALDESAGKVLYSFLTDTGYLRRLAEEGTASAHEGVRNISRFFETIKRMEETLFIRKTQTLVDELRLLLDSGDNPAAPEDFETDAVNVLTVHKAKGLEFPTVFMVDLVSERFPRREKSDLLELPAPLIKDILPSGDFHLQEERRLFYVGMTRARDELMLTSSSDRGGVRMRKPSRFIAEALSALSEKHARPAKATKAEANRVLETERASRPALGPEVGSANFDAEPLHLSFYQIDDYLSCPLKYRFGHILKVPRLPNHNLIYGNAVHASVSFYFRRALEGIKTTEAEMMDAFRASWRSSGFISKDHEKERFKAGAASLKRFFENAGSIVPVAVERAFSVAIGDAVLKGRWDLIVERPDGRYIVDFKTSDVKDAEKAVEKTKTSLQLMLYTLAYREVFNALPAGCELFFMDAGLAGSCVFGTKELDKASSAVFEVNAGVRNKEFGPRPGPMNCARCDYSNVCLKDSEGKEVRTVFSGT